MQDGSRRHARPWTRRPITKALGALLAAGLLTTGATTLVPGGAGANIVQPASGEVVRDEVVTIKEDRGGIQTFSSATASPASGECLGTSSPYSRIEVRNAANALVFSADSPRQSRLFGLSYVASGPWQTTFTIPPNPPGFYTVTTYVRDVNRHRVSFLSQQCQLKPEVALPSVTFEYRPWQHSFDDLLGGGTVAMNTAPAEFNVTVDGNRSPIIDGSKSTTFFSSPTSLLTALPADPSTCGTDPASCVPADAISCNPSAGCEPQFVVINHNTAGSTLVGVFDIDSGAFAAVASVNGNTRVLFSAGDELDGVIESTLADLVGAADANGLDLLALLATEVEARLAKEDGTSTVLSLSLLEGLAITESGTGPTGASIRATYGLAAGAAIIHTYTYTVPYADCNVNGYRVSESQLIPSIGLAGAPASVVGIAALLGIGGPVKRVTGQWPAGTGNHIVSPLTVDTEADEPNGLPVWLPAVSGTGPAVPDSEIDFVGVGTVVQIPDICIAPIPVLLPDGTAIGFGLLLGTGVALFDNPLPVGFDDIPLLFDEQSPEVQSLMAQISAAIDEITGGVLGNPDVQAVLDEILANVPLGDLLGAL